MIRGRTIVWFGLAVGLGAGLFYVKHEVQLLEEELQRLDRKILADQEAIHVLRAEWTYLNQPQRLAALSRRYLELAPPTTAQITTIDDLPLRLDTVITKADNPTPVGGVNQTAQGRGP
jgi:cell division protein FtsL